MSRFHFLSPLVGWPHLFGLLQERFFPLRDYLQLLLVGGTAQPWIGGMDRVPGEVGACQPLTITTYVIVIPVCACVQIVHLIYVHKPVFFDFPILSVYLLSTL